MSASERIVELPIFGSSDGNVEPHIGSNEYSHLPSGNAPRGRSGAVQQQLGREIWKCLWSHRIWRQNSPTTCCAARMRLPHSFLENAEPPESVLPSRVLPAAGL